MGYKIETGTETEQSGFSGEDMFITRIWECASLFRSPSTLTAAYADSALISSEASLWLARILGTRGVQEGRGGDRCQVHI